ANLLPRIWFQASRDLHEGLDTGPFLSCAKQPPPRIKELAHHPAMQTRPLRVPFVTCARRLERGYCPTIEVMAM
ncbi:hypothetical protein, partial [Pseudomonas aeruginosa]|uniref:hypothetical protein n=1 Tax=Pseudomonas aeruginosa TaxID=287 RepID=UPI001968FA3A